MGERVSQARIRPPADQGAALINGVEAEDHPHGGRLAGPVGADEAGDASGRHREREPVQGEGFAEAIARAAVIGLSVEVGLVLCVLALATTLPLATLPPKGAAPAATVACVISLAFFHTITVAGVAAELIVLYRLGRIGAPRRGTQLVAAALATPFV